MYKPYSEKNVSTILPKKLKEFRLNKNLTISEVGSFVNKTKAAVSMWENGKTLPDIYTLLKLCELYEITDFNEFLDDKNDYTTISKKEKNVIELYRKSSKSIQKSIETILKEINKNSIT